MTASPFEVRFDAAVVPLDRADFQAVIDGKPVDLYTLRNRHGMTVNLTNHGARIVQVLVPDRRGVFADVVLGYDSIAAVVAGHPSMGAFIGRYANRIAHAAYTLNGQQIRLSANDGPNSLHGGQKGSRHQVFAARQLSDSAVEMSYVFKDGEEGHPGTLPVTLTYVLNEHNELSIEWVAFADDKPTVANFTGHAFFNLTGDPTRSVLDHVVSVDAERFLPIDRSLIPTGELRAVHGTPLDFRQGKALGRDIDSPDEQLTLAKGYDHHFALDQPQAGALTRAASAFEPGSGRLLEVWTTEPGLQLFSGNNLDSKPPRDRGKGGRLFVFRGGFCMEPSRFPDGPNQPQFPSTVLEPGAWYTGTIAYRFSLRQ